MWDMSNNPVERIYSQAAFMLAKEIRNMPVPKPNNPFEGGAA